MSSKIETATFVDPEAQHLQPQPQPQPQHQTTIQTNTQPWVEKYRPKTFETIVLDGINRKILHNMVYKKNVPNLLFYGPPGTGKTTTIIALIKQIQEYNNETGSDLIIHLNASDERGIDVIRNQIQQFVVSRPLFGNGTKFVILDEVDYMTKNAQQALKNIIHVHENVRFCLICNYISRIESFLQDECITLHFNTLPQEDIIQFLKTIVEYENLTYDENELMDIQQYYKSDIRSMVNYIQTNQCKTRIYKLWNTQEIKEFLCFLKHPDTDHALFKHKLHTLSMTYNIDYKHIFLKLFYYLIETNDEDDTNDMYNKYDVLTSTSIPECPFIENMIYIIHNNTVNSDYCISYVWYKLRGFLSKSNSIS